MTTDYKAFVSSTAKDLQPHRAHVIRELRRAGFHVDPMEDWPASADEPKKFSQERLDGCHLCVLLIARRRGTVPAGDTLSITQQEYEEALRLGIDVLPYFLDDAETDWPAEFDERTTDERFRVWRAELEQRYGLEPRRFDKQPASIGIGAASSRWRQENGFKVALRRYLQLVEHEHGFIRFVSLPRLEDNRYAPIQRLYVEPAVAPRWVSPDVDPAEWPATQPVLDAVAEHRRLVLLGDPGSGKSTLVSWIAWQLARHHHAGASLWTERLGRLVPLPMILRDLGIGPGVTWDKLLDAFTLQPMGKLLTLTNLRKLLADGQAMIMLDGLDEIGNPAVRLDMREAFWTGILRFGNCRFLLTSRVVGYDEAPVHFEEVYADESETHLNMLRKRTRAELRYVTPFDNPRVDQFALNWNILREPSEPQARQTAKKLIEAVRNHESTCKLGRIPNLLTMMALIFRIKARPPHGRALLYDDIAEAYLESIDWYRGIRTRLEPLDEKKRWLGRVAFEMQRQRSARTGVARPESAKGVVDDAELATPFADSGRATPDEIFASSDDVCRWIAAEMSESGKETSAEDAALVVADLARRSGLVLPRGHDRFAFLHLSFQEYFAAEFLQDQIISPAWLTEDADAIAPGATKQDLHNYARDPVWRETLVFLVELLFNGNRRWLKPTRDCLFGRDFAAVTPDDPHADGLAVLLAHLAVDPHSGFTDAERQQAIAVCCRFEVTSQKRATDKKKLYLHKNEVARVLFGAETEYRTLVAQSFVEAAQTIDLTALNLSGTGVSDVRPLSTLANLQSLFLSDTGVSDVGPLAVLAKLQLLDLRRTGVSDVRPLAALANLEVLHLNRTGVSDVRPLVSLAKLRDLGLKGTKVSQTELARLKAALPACDIFHD